MRTLEEIRVALARYAHDSAWSGWVKYQFTKAPVNPDGSWTMPASFVERWQRQMNTGYDDLPENEKQGDLKEADEMIRVAEFDTLCASLTLTEAALSAAGALIDAYENLKAYEDSKYHDTYTTALAALAEEVTK